MSARGLRRSQEQAHQRELLATLRDEPGTFARECAAALTALDAYITQSFFGTLTKTGTSAQRCTRRA